MFTSPSNIEPSQLDKAIEAVLNEMLSLEVDTEKYANALDKLERLTKLKNARRDPLVSPEVLVTAGANLLGIALILNYEKLGVVTSKAVGFVMKTRT